MSVYGGPISYLGPSVSSPNPQLTVRLLARRFADVDTDHLCAGQRANWWTVPQLTREVSILIVGRKSNKSLCP